MSSHADRLWAMTPSPEARIAALALAERVIDIMFQRGHDWIGCRDRAHVRDAVVRAALTASPAPGVTVTVEQLRSIEWAGDFETGDPVCPVCCCIRHSKPRVGGHRFDCWLNTAIQSATPGGDAPLGTETR